MNGNIGNTEKDRAFCSNKTQTHVWVAERASGSAAAWQVPRAGHLLQHNVSLAEALSLNTALKSLDLCHECVCGMGGDKVRVGEKEGERRE